MRRALPPLTVLVALAVTASPAMAQPRESALAAALVGSASYSPAIPLTGASYPAWTMTLTGASAGEGATAPAPVNGAVAVQLDACTFNGAASGSGESWGSGSGSFSGSCSLSGPEVTLSPLGPGTLTNAMTVSGTYTRVGVIEVFTGRCVYAIGSVSGSGTLAAAFVLAPTNPTTWTSFAATGTLACAFAGT